MLGLKVRTGIGIVVAYTAYSTYVQLRTSYEISERARLKLLESDLENSKTADWPATKFSSMIVGGKFVNPFTEYRSQTVFEFIFCRAAELFHAKPRGGVPLDPAVIRKILPSRQPDFDLLFRNAREYALGGRKSAVELSSLLASHNERSFTSLSNAAADADVVSSPPTPTLTPNPIGSIIDLSKTGPAHHGNNYAISGNETEELLEDLPDVDNRLTLTWLGQSCAFVQFPGFNMITDPCFGEHLISQYVGPKRISPAPCQIEDLPPVDLVLVSHDHPDHLELEAAEQIGNNALWIVPTGVAKHLATRGITNVREMDWWEKIRLSGIVGSGPSSKFALLGEEGYKANDVTLLNHNNKNDDKYHGWEVACTPAMHWSGRKMIDSNSTLWCSFMVLRHGDPIFYHAGDTGYSPDLFNGIRKVFGRGCQVAMLPCGAYTPRWHLRPQHIDPYEAVQVMKDLQAHKMVGVHWGTFVLSDEHFLEPRDILHDIAKRNNIENDVIAPEFGRTLVFRLDHDLHTFGRKIPIRDGFALLMD